MTSAFVLASARGPSAPPGIRAATLSMVCLGAAFGLLLARDGAPEWLSLLGPNALFWLSAALMHHAHRAFGSGRGPVRWTAALVAGSVTGFSAMIALGAPYGVRAISSSLVLAVLLWASCFELAREGGLTREPSRKISLALMGISASGLTLRTLLLLPSWALATRPTTPPFQMLVAHVPGFLLAQGFGMAFLLMHRERSAATAKALASTDALTGCANRRALEAQVQVELAYAARKKRPCAVVIADLDHFKKVNDVHGHAAGDAVLVEAARLLRSSVRPGDLVARYGGEEFCVLLRDADSTLASIAAERLCAALRGMKCEVNGASISVRASVGVAASPTDGTEPWESLFRRADGALYRAKEQGRDRVVAAL